jgi:hypothetical protein
MAGLFQENGVNVIMAVVEAPFRFLKVNEELFLPDPAKFRHAELRKTPEGFDAINVVLSTGEFIGMVVHSVVPEAVCDKSVVSLPTVGVKITAFDDATLENRHQFCLGAVFNNAHKHPSLAFVKTKNRCLSTPATPSSATNSALQSFKAILLAEAPVSFRHRNLFVSENALYLV